MSVNFLDPRLPDRFWDKCIPEPNTGCWLWVGSAATRGYGYIAAMGRSKRAHRVAFEVLVRIVPDGMVLDHLCRQPCCVNPLHLEAVTSRVNILRGIGPTARNAVVTHCVRGHEYTPGNTRVRDKGRDCQTCRRDWAKEAARISRLLRAKNLLVSNGNAIREAAGAFAEARPGSQEESASLAALLHLTRPGIEKKA